MNEGWRFEAENKKLMRKQKNMHIPIDFFSSLFPKFFTNSFFHKNEPLSNY